LNLLNPTPIKIAPINSSNPIIMPCGRALNPKNPVGPGVGEFPNGGPGAGEQELPIMCLIDSDRVNSNPCTIKACVGGVCRTVPKANNSSCGYGEECKNAVCVPIEGVESVSVQPGIDVVGLVGSETGTVLVVVVSILGLIVFTGYKLFYLK
jgi:hypothetical protein